MIWRIRERSAFARLERDGRRTRAGVLWCTYLLDSSASPPQVAFAIGRAYGSAVTRNRMRRRLRALVAGNPPPAGLYLIGARPAAGRRSSIELAYDWASMVRSASTPSSMPIAPPAAVPVVMPAAPTPGPSAPCCG